MRNLFQNFVVWIVKALIRPTSSGEDQLADTDNVIYVLQRDDVALVGPRPEWLPEKATPMARPMPADGESNVAVLLPLTMAYDAAGQTVTAAAALPIYVSGDSPWQTVAARRAAAQQAD